MSANRAIKEEYEIVAYPKLNHVRASIVQIVSRNTHVHRALELGLTLAGDGLVRVGTEAFPISAGSLFFLNANQPHEIIASSGEGVRIAYLQVSSSFCSEYVSCFRNLELLKNDLSTYLPKDTLMELIGLTVQSLTDYMAEDSNLHPLRCICSIGQLLVKLMTCVPYRLISESAYLARNKKMARLSRITEYIDNNYAEKITLEILAKQEGVTTTYLSHFIHDNLNMTFQEYVANQRFERALKLLRNTTMCLTDVSVVCGFSDVKYLSKMLEKQFGSSARVCRDLLYLQPEPPQRSGEAQTFASEELGKTWLSTFWQEYCAKGSE